MNLPISLTNSLLNVKGFDKEAFEKVHFSGEQITSIRLNPAKWPNVRREKSDVKPETFIIHHSSFTIDQNVPWSAQGYYLAARPSFTLDPLLHAGAYYVQEASSMFLEQALKQSIDLSQPLKVLDLCAAPGGKSTLIQSLVSAESLLVSNEVIKSRVTVLEENLTKWGGLNVVVTNNDAADFAKLPNFFDVMVIDAPCSGSGLFRKDVQAINEWSEQNVQLCCQRQQRIVADAYAALKQHGVLIYSTCSYSTAENETVLDWIIETFEVSSLKLDIDADWGIVETVSERQKAFGYRFFPDKVKGEGFFIAAFKKSNGDVESSPKIKKPKIEKISKAEEAIIRPWLKDATQIQLFRLGERILAFPKTSETELMTLIETVYIKKAGIAIGKIAGKELIPDHELAMSNLVNEQVVTISLKKEEALQYLRKEEVKINSTHRGWALMQYEGVNLGWIKILPNRSNNYYPKEWRILKRSDA